MKYYKVNEEDLLMLLEDSLAMASTVELELMASYYKSLGFEVEPIVKDLAKLQLKINFQEIR